ncbi:MAG: InlB B-repeat-containing protein [Eubacteriaceae bacterium]|nr:InlB B-repeat-containing protein [Eubacteriaceae bacterium]
MKKILSVILCLAVVLTSLPAHAFADPVSAEPPAAVETAAPEEPAGEEASAADLNSQRFTSEDGTVSVTGMLPATTVVAASEVTDAPLKRLFRGIMRKGGAEQAPGNALNSLSADDIAAFYDIKLSDGGSEIQPSEPVLVTIREVNIKGSSAVVYHILEDVNSIQKGLADGTVSAVTAGALFEHASDAAKAAAFEAAGVEDTVFVEVIDGTVSDGAVSFTASSFSIYGIGEVPQRAVFVFYNGNEEVSRQTITKKTVNGTTTISSLFQPTFDYDYGKTLVAWSFNQNATADDTEGLYQINDINGLIEDDPDSYFAENPEVPEYKVYAVFHDAYYLRYLYQKANGTTIVLETFEVRTDATEAERTVRVKHINDFDDLDIGESFVFTGWVDAQRSTNYPYDLNDPPVSDGDYHHITLDGHYDLYMKVEGSYWLVFDSNAGGPGSGATYTPPQLLVGTDAKTEKPADPTRKGYSFQGWYLDPEPEEGATPFEFGGALTEDTVIYAKWEPDATKYYVLFWTQKANTTGTDPKTDYDLKETSERDAVTDQLVQITTADTQMNYGSYYIYDAVLTDTEAVKAASDDSTVLNVYYNRKTYTLRFFYARSFDLSSDAQYEEYREKISPDAVNGQIAGYAGNPNAEYYTSETGNTRVYWRNNQFESATVIREQVGTAANGAGTDLQGNAFTGSTAATYYSAQTGGTRVYWRNNQFETDSADGRELLGYVSNGTGITGNNNTSYYGSETATQASSQRVYWRRSAFRTTDKNNGPLFTGYVWAATVKYTGDIYEEHSRYSGEVWVVKTRPVGGNVETRIQVNNSESGFRKNQDDGIEHALTMVYNNDYDRDATNSESADNHKTNTWKTVDVDDPDDLFKDKSAYITRLQQNNVPISFGDVDISGVRTWLVTGENANLNTAGNDGLTITETVLDGDVTYYYFDIELPYGYELRNVWPQVGDTGDYDFADLTHQNYVEKNGESPYLTAFTWTNWKGPNANGAALSGIPQKVDEELFHAIDQDPADPTDGGFGYFLLYWRNEAYQPVAYRVYFSALSGETADRTYGGVDYVEQTEISYLAYLGAGDPTGNPVDGGNVANLVIDGVEYVYREGDLARNENGTGDDTNFNGTTVRGTIHAYYDRLTYPITFISATDQNYDIGSGYPAHTAVPYGEDISVYNDVVPTNGGEKYFFSGWYEDSTFKVPYTFEKMPNAPVTVYARWETYRIRTVLVPTKDNAHNDDVYFPNNQALYFRLDYGESVSDANIKEGVAQRIGYRLEGWYTDPDFIESTRFEFNEPLVNGSAGVDMTYQQSEDWQQTEEYPHGRYGDNDGEHDNVIGILKLYAKWVKDVGNIYVEYTVPETYVNRDTQGNLITVIPASNEEYTIAPNETSVTINTAEAPTKYKGGYEFTKWALVAGDGVTVTETVADPEKTMVVPTNCIQTRELTDDDGETFTIQVIVLQAQFDITAENVTELTYDGNGGTEPDSDVTSKTVSLLVNENVTLLGSDTFVREGYELIGWSLNKDLSPEAFEQLLASKEDASSQGHEELTLEDTPERYVYAFGEIVIIDNETRDELNTEDNTLYAIWKALYSTITVKKTGMSSSYESAVFVVNGPGYENLKVIVLNGESVVIANCQIGGTYTVAEEGSWTWNYGIKSVSGDDDAETNGYQVVVSSDASDNEITFKNEKTIDKWITDTDTAVNAFPETLEQPAAILPDPPKEVPEGDDPDGNGENPEGGRRS